MLEELKRQVFEANLALRDAGLVFRTFGNVSGVDRASGHVVIKPSGLPYDEMRPKHMVVVSLGTGETAEGEMRPSSDTPTHLAIYRAFAAVGGVAHSHSLYATAWAQARREIPVFGTTHADYYRGAVPATRLLTVEEIRGDYEANTGKVIVERFASLDPAEFPSVLVADHGPFSFGADADAAVESAATLEHIARLASKTIRVEMYPRPSQPELIDRHFLRKHGQDAYYGQ